RRILPCQGLAATPATARDLRAARPASGRTSKRQRYERPAIIRAGTGTPGRDRTCDLRIRRPFWHEQPPHVVTVRLKASQSPGGLPAPDHWVEWQPRMGPGMA